MSGDTIGIQPPADWRHFRRPGVYEAECRLFPLEVLAANMEPGCPRPWLDGSGGGSVAEMDRIEGCGMRLAPV